MRRIALGLGLLFAGCARTPAPGPRVPLYSDLGTFTVPISTKVPATQRYFDQGVRLSYAFNHAEAIRAFEEAARLDPTCAICHWGAALALGPNINAPMDSVSGIEAWRALERAQALRSKASPREQALIDALSARYQPNPRSDRAGLDSGYARAMEQVVARFPADREVATLYAESLMDLRPWDYWEGPGRPRPGTAVIVQLLEGVLAADSTHPGACHFSIHLYEATEPARALPCAERLAALMPGAGHLVHMPAHIYVRIGRYADAIAHNQHAAHADSTFAATERVSPAYALLYVPHNFHFLGFAAMLAGQENVAIEAGKRTTETMPIEGAAGVPEYQPMVAFHQLMLLKFGRWADLISLPLPDTTLPVARAVADYARGTALAATGRVAEARALLGSIGRRGGGLSGIAAGIVSLATHSLAAEIASRTGQWPTAERELREAMAIEDGFSYMEPPWWIEPVRQPLGAVLLAAGKPAAAEIVYREDLARFPKNVWSLVGLERSLRAQHRRDPALEELVHGAVGLAGEPIATSHR